MFVRCLGGVCEVFVRCLGGVCEVSVRCLKCKLTTTNVY